MDVNVLHYPYPSTTTDLDWTELNGTVTWKGNYWASLGYSNEALGYDESGVYGLVGAKFPVNDRFRFEATAAYYALEDLDRRRSRRQLCARFAQCGLGVHQTRCEVHRRGAPDRARHRFEGGGFLRRRFRRQPHRSRTASILLRRHDMPGWLALVCAIAIVIAAAYLLFVILRPEHSERCRP